MSRHYQTRATTRAPGTSSSSSGTPRPYETRATKRAGTSSEMEGGVNKYNDLLRCRATTEEELEVMEPKRMVNSWNLFLKENKGKLQELNKNNTEKKDFAGIWKDLPNHEKKKYENKAHKVKVLVRCITKKFLDALENLEPERQKMLEDTPFYKLLEIKPGIQDNEKIKQLASLFNTDEKCLEIKGVKYVVTAEDFTQIMGMEDGEEKITKLKQVKGKPDIDMKEIVNQLSEGKNEDEVKRAYALLALRYIICAPPKGALGHSFLNLVQDVGSLNKKKWATYAIESLVEGIKIYKTGKGKGERNLGGCTIFLQLYAEKMIPKENLPWGCDDMRHKKKRGKDCTDSSKTTEGLSIEKAKELFYQTDESVMVDIDKLRKRNFNKYKKNPTEQEFVEVEDSAFGDEDWSMK
ncbi:aminotransferase-like mobile domain-containing protein [Tanacetum coccineum]